MNKRQLITFTAAALAAAALISIGIFRNFDSNLGVNFGKHGPKAELLLPPSDKNEARRVRTPDGQGGAVDQVQLTSGYSREVHLTDVVNNRRSLELTFFPPGPGEKRGPLASEVKFSRNGIGIASEKGYDRDHHLILYGQMVWNAEKKEWQYLSTSFFPTGSHRQAELKNTKGNLLQVTQWRESGSLLLKRKHSEYATNSWDTESFAEDGKTLEWTDQRYYGLYHVIEFYGDGKTPKTDSQVQPYDTKFTSFRPDGSKEVAFELMSNYAIDQSVYDKKGTIQIDRFFIQAKKKAADGKPVYVLSHVKLYDKDGHDFARYDLDDDGKLQEVLINGNASHGRVLYHFKDGVCVKKDVDDNQGVAHSVDNPKGVPDFTVLASWIEPPAIPPIPASRISVESEISSGPY